MAAVGEIAGEEGVALGFAFADIRSEKAAAGESGLLGLQAGFRGRERLIESFGRRAEQVQSVARRHEIRGQQQSQRYADEHARLFPSGTPGGQ